ncbi:centrosomal protein of 128 kDa-like [Gigantopelta aegis]|uniref:centrosomal protein of 128 kDa-like n=1 Tax=Gigantopelta aegis TaxID=1735272 RepID=UPI001B88B77E|nr:centrosomal protein of 128 kDa-like [Gigantopelta aegis]
MASRNNGTHFSSESDEYYLPPGRSRQLDMDPRVEELTSNLQDTTRNLRQLDHMLDQYRDVGHDQRSAVDRLRSDVERTHDDIREERLRSTVNTERDYGSDTESPSSSRRRKRKSSVRFADDMNKELHHIHQNVRDLSSEQLKMEESFNKEVDRRERDAFETQRSLRRLSDDVRRLTPPPDTIGDRVERRLAAIQNEIRTDHIFRDKHDDLQTLSSDLKAAIQQQQQPSIHEDLLRTHYLQTETVKHRFESDLENVKRRLDQSEGSRSVLQQQVEDLRNQLTKADQERNRSRICIQEVALEEEMRERRKRKASDEDYSRQRIEHEIQELRSQLARSVGAVTELEDLRRAVEKSERQRMQLSDHIENLTKDLDNREKQNAKLIMELKAVSDKCEGSDRQNMLLATQLEDVLQKFKDTSRDLEKTSNELKNTQLSLYETDKKKEDYKIRAQETVRQWKLKVKQLEKEVDRQKHASNQMMHRNEQLVKEMESNRSQNTHTGFQFDALRKELSDALAVRAAQDEELRLKDVEVNELKSVRMDLEKELRDVRTLADRMENELHSLRERLADVSSDKHQLEDRLSAVEAAHLLAQDQANQLQMELKELSTIKADLAGQCAEANGKIHDFRQMVLELQHREKAAKEESDIYKRQLLEERNNHQKLLESMKIELNEAKVREAHMKHDLSRRFKRGHVENEASLQALMIEIQEEKSVSKIARRNEEKLKSEVERLQALIKKYEEDNIKLVKKLEMMRQEFENQTYLAEDDIVRVKRLDEQLYELQTQLRNMEKQQYNLIQEIALETDVLVEAGRPDAVSKYQPLNGVIDCSKGASYLMCHIKNKLKWIRNELFERIIREQKLRQDFRQALNSTDADRNYLLQELARRDNELDDLAAAKQELAFRDIANMNAVEALEEHILDLTDELHMQKVKQVEQEITFEMEKQHIIDEMEDVVDSQKERDLIEQRYRRLQNTMKSLQSDLQSTGLSFNKTAVANGEKPSILRSSTPTSTPKKKNHVRIVESPPVLDRPPSRSNSQYIPLRDDLNKTPPPLSLSDEEFKKRFLPHTPEAVGRGKLNAVDCS